MHELNNKYFFFHIVDYFQNTYTKCSYETNHLHALHGPTSIFFCKATPGKIDRN